MKKIKIVISILIWVVFSYTYVQNFQFLEGINNKFTDIFFDIRGEKKPSDKIVIVDVDEKSLSHMNGFSREKYAHLIDHLTKAGALVIGLNMTFPYNKDYDEILATSLKKAKSISGYVFDFSSSNIVGEIPNTSSPVVQTNYETKEYLPEAKGIISNIALLQNASQLSGFFNMISDEDGVVRSVPLVIKFSDSLYPSLALQIAKQYLKKKNIIIEYSSAGINRIILDNHTIASDRFGRMMLNFRATSKTYKYISAYKIYDENFNQEIIKDKIVLISSSTSRFRDLRATPYDSTFEAVEIQANTIDNIINSDFLSKPNWVESVDMFFLLILVLLLLKFSMYSAVKNTIFSVTLISGFFIFSFLLFIQFGLILNILFPLVIGFILYAVLTLIEYINEVKLKEKLNTQLISEMKDRQMIIEDEVMQKTYELHKALKDKTTLLRELHHRVKNNLQLILSITRLQQHELKDSKLNEEFSKLQSRIKSIAKTHEILCDNDDISSVNMSQYIGELCEEMESGLMQDNIETDIEINVQVTLPLRQAVYVGLVINEIMSNSIKHAFDEKGGKIYIYLAKQIDEYILRISDDGKRYEKDSLKGGSLGLKLVESLVVSQLEGSIKVQSDNRFGYDIRFKEGEL